MRVPVAAVVASLLAAVLAGCAGSDDASKPTSNVDEFDANPWEAGLSGFYATPDGVKVANDTDRRSRLGDGPAPGAAVFDAFVTGFMEAHDIPAGQAAVMHDGKLIHERGYGHVDEAGTRVADATTMFRVASITKPITHALVTLQVEQGLYNLTDPVFCVPPAPAPNCRLPIEPHPAHPIVDERIADVQVGHLLAHTGGWGDKMDWVWIGLGPHTVADAFGIESPPPTWRMAQYVMGEELADPPGERFWYCNMCYVLAGLVAEAATGADLQALYGAYLFRPLEVAGDAELGRTLPEDRNPREPFYQCEVMRPSVYDRNETVCGADGAFSMEILSSAGGLVSTAAAIAALHGAYQDGLARYTGPRINGQGAYEPLYDSHGHGGRITGGGVTGWSGVIRDRLGVAGEVQYVLLFNSSVVGCVQASPSGVDDDGACDLDDFEDAVANLAVAQGAADR